MGNNDSTHDTEGGRLAAALGFLRLTQTALARELDVTPGYVNSVIHGRKPVSAKILNTAEGVWGVRPEWVMDGELPMVGRPRWSTVGAVDGPQVATPTVEVTELVEMRERAWAAYEAAVTLLLSSDDGSDKARMVRLLHEAFQGDPKVQAKLLSYMEGLRDAQGL